jgi:hypothetical protein
MSETIGLAHLAQPAAAPDRNGAAGSFHRDCNVDAFDFVKKVNCFSGWFQN